MDDVFSVPVTIRGYECTQGAVVGLPQILSLCEHCRWEWILEPRFGLVEPLHEGHFFVVHRATLGVVRTFGIGTKLVVRAILREVGRVNCIVEQDLLREDGVLLARAFINAIWIAPSGRMARVPNHVREATTDAPLPSRTDVPADAGRPGSFLSPPEQRFEPTLDDTVFRDVPGDAVTSLVRVRPSDCDVHDHVNNANYLRLFEDALGAPAREATIDYRGQAVAHDELTMWQWPVSNDCVAFVLARSADPNAVMARAVLTPRAT
ncbi:MAG: acyl-CoA thioesterase [Myxococcota bacterium]